MKSILIVLCITVAALALRAVRVGHRPVHHDEANQAVRCRLLLEEGHYAYDPADHHGPTLYYLALPLLRLQSGGDFAAARIEAFRWLPILAGVALVLAPLLMRRALGLNAILWAALFTALSPALVYYSRFFIQEMLFVLFACLFLGGLWLCVAGGGWRSAVLTGIAAGLMQATKETCIIFFGCAALAGAVAVFAHGAFPTGAERRRWRIVTLTAAAAALVTSVLLYSSFFAHPRGLLDAVRAYGNVVWRGTGSGVHTHPWHYYLHLLSFWRHGRGPVWSEAAILVLALIGAFRCITGRVPHPAWGRFLALYTLLLLIVYSLVPYKTPWNVCLFLHAATLTAGVGCAAVLGQNHGRRRVFICAILLGLASHLGRQAWLAAVPMSADPENPYVYAHTSRDFLGAVKRIEDAAAIHPEGRSLRVDVASSVTDAWPLPWYLRAFSRVGYFPEKHLPADPQIPVIVSPTGISEELGAWMGDRYLTGLWQLRPGTFITVSVRRDLMEQIAAASTSSPRP